MYEYTVHVLLYPRSEKYAAKSSENLSEEEFGEQLDGQRGTLEFAVNEKLVGQDVDGCKTLVWDHGD
jgi:hypothetical protein